MPGIVFDKNTAIKELVDKMPAKAIDKAGFFQKIYNEIMRRQLRPASVFYLAVSGGADSITLLYLALFLQRRQLVKKLRVLHFNHQLRPESDVYEDLYLEKLCAKLKLDYLSATSDVARKASASGKGIEETARDLRHAFFRSQMQEEDALLLLGHNKSDRAETLILNMQRGAGAAGLSAMPFYNRESSILRPLLFKSQSEIREFCERSGYFYCQDKTNSQNLYSRNKIRNLLLPLWDEIAECKIEDKLSNLAEYIEADHQLLNESASEHEAQAEISSNMLNLLKLKHLPRPLLQRVLSNFAATKNGLSLNSGQLNMICEAIESDSGRADFDLSDGKRLLLRKDLLILK